MVDDSRPNGGKRMKYIIGFLVAIACVYLWFSANYIKVPFNIGYVHRDNVVTVGERE